MHANAGKSGYSDFVYFGIMGLDFYQEGKDGAMPEKGSNSPSLPMKGKQRSIFRAIFYGCAAGSILAVGIQSFDVLAGNNFHTIVPGRVYRSAQLSGPRLKEIISEQGIRTVINLRGTCTNLPWYMEESRATHDLNVAQEDLCFSAGRLPSASEMRRFVEVLDNTEYPILFHCRRGSDRTGLASAVLLLLNGDVSFALARKQLGLRFGHLPLGRSAFIDRFFDYYQEWLHSQSLEHSPDAFRKWLASDRFPGECRSRIEPMEIPSMVAKGEAPAIKVRVHNLGMNSWRLRPEGNVGIHVGFILLDNTGQSVADGRSGLFDALVHPGQSIDLTLAMPILAQSGRYRLLVDMVDEQQGWFNQAGSELLDRELVVKDK
jgi:protein tyrosine phosphatase (PTP) superfamily phosphohydrolase (DUF442 family)